ncbi:ABC transporter ATP-binding protein [Actinomycetospora chlora]|uniref:ABC transporter ATP-binding protein n=1 Tax=Actinomycetospora chlora TaxID=663608 RepID=A0ABP9BZW3_9PSEU
MTTTPPTAAAVLRGSVRDQRGPVASAALLFAGHQGCEALVPVLVGVVVDRAVATGDPVALLGWLAVLGLDFLVLSSCYRWGARRAWLGDVRADQRLRLLLADRLLDPRGGAEAGRLPGELANVAVADAKRVGILNFALPLGLAALTAMLVAAVALLRTSVPLGLLILLGTPPLLLVVHLLGLPLQRRSGPEQERAARASGVAADLVDGVRVLKGLGAVPAAVARYRGASREALGATLGATRVQAGYQGAVLAANGLFLALVALVGGRLAADGALSIGGLVAAVGLAQFLITPLQMLGWVNGRIAQGRASAARIAAVLATGPAVADGDPDVPAPPARPALALHDLHHGTLRGLDLDVGAGETVGVVSADPADAAALVACLAREVDPERGTITVGGGPLARHPPRVARASVLVAAHGAELFSGSLHENVAAAARDPAPVGAAMAAARADQVAEVLPDGAATVLTEQGRSLSGGQRQRVALARALAADAPVLVLHDPTTAVDAVTEVLIADGLAALRADRTTLVLATSPALLAVTDRVVLVVDGRVAAVGTHAELMGSSSAYRDVVTA